MFSSLMVVELMRRILETVIKTVARSTIGHFSLKHLFQPTRRNFRCSRREYNALSFSNIHFEISRNVKIFIKIVSAFLFFRVLNSTIPIGLVMEFTFLVQLHE